MGIQRPAVGSASILICRAGVIFSVRAAIVKKLPGRGGPFPPGEMGRKNNGRDPAAADANRAPSAARRLQNLPLLPGVLWRYFSETNSTSPNPAGTKV